MQYKQKYRQSLTKKFKTSLQLARPFKTFFFGTIDEENNDRYQDGTNETNEH